MKLHQTENYKKTQKYGLDDEVPITVHDPGEGLYLDGGEYEGNSKSKGNFQITR